MNVFNKLKNGMSYYVFNFYNTFLRCQNYVLSFVYKYNNQRKPNLYETSQQV